MNKKHRISLGIWILFMLVLVILPCCRGGNKAPKEEVSEEIPIDNTAILQDIKQAEKIFQALPSPPRIGHAY